MRINDIDLRKWKDYENIWTDSLWLIPNRDRSPYHNPDYHGNFVPQIPKQAILRYTKEYDWILDPFLGLGTTLIEARLLNRNGVGIELNENISQKARLLIEKVPSNSKFEIFTDDATDPTTFNKVRRVHEKFQLVILHPPYWDIIKFSTSQNDLSNTQSLKEYLSRLKLTIKYCYEMLEENRFMVFVIGDKYHNSTLVPLGHYTLQLLLEFNLKLKGIVVKNIEENREKRGKYSLWRYRALKGGYFVFRHEYIYFLQKT